MLPIYFGRWSPFRIWSFNVLVFGKLISAPAGSNLFLLMSRWVFGVAASVICWSCALDDLRAAFSKCLHFFKFPLGDVYGRNMQWKKDERGGAVTNIYERQKECKTNWMCTDAILVLILQQVSRFEIILFFNFHQHSLLSISRISYTSFLQNVLLPKSKESFKIFNFD